MIASFFDGRVRLRDEALKNPEFMARVKDLVGSHKGIREIQDNPRTGSLLICYDPAAISREELLLAAEVFDSEAVTVSKPEKRCRPLPALLSKRQEIRLLSALFGLTLLSGFANKGLHIAAGGLLTLLASKHLFDRRRSL